MTLGRWIAAPGAAPERLQLVPPAVDPPDEEVRGGVQGLDREPQLGRQAQEGESLVGGATEPDDVHVLGRPPGLEPQGDQGAPHQQPIAGQPLGDRLDDPLQARPVQIHGATIGDVAVSWKVLVEAGVPDGAVRFAPARLDRQDVSRAVHDLATAPEAIEPRQVEPLLAWLRGWRRHWPGSFASVLGTDGSASSRVWRRALRMRPAT